MYFLYLYVATVMINNTIWKECVQALCSCMGIYHVLVFFDVGIIML